VNIAYLDNVIYSNILYKAYIGINKNWSGGINIPQIEDIKGSRNN